MNEKLLNFKSELKALLEKYNASIDYDFSECADTHGMGDSGLAIYLDNQKAEYFPYEQRLGAWELRRKTLEIDFAQPTWQRENNRL